MKVHSTGAGFWEFIFHCPGCGCAHGFKTASWPMPDRLDEHQQKMFKDNNWAWNGDFDNPTISPSLNVLKQIGKNEKGEPIYETTCHSFVEDGHIRFLSDCKHELVSQVVLIPEF